MNTKVLTLLGCSGSLAAVLIAAHPAQAIPKKIQDEIAPRSGVTSTSTSSSQQEFPQTSNISEAIVKQYAQAKYGCNCASCMNLARQALQQSSSSPTNTIMPGF